MWTHSRVHDSFDAAIWIRVITLTALIQWFYFNACDVTNDIESSITDELKSIIDANLNPVLDRRQSYSYNLACSFYRPSFLRLKLR